MRISIFSLVLTILLSSFAIEGVYESKVAEHRATKDERFSDKKLTPFKKRKDRKKFEGLKYFPVDDKYRVKAYFLKSEVESKIEMPTSGDETKDYYKFGELHFTLKGRSMRLNVYQASEFKNDPKYKNMLFLPFTDLTNGKETYGGGRYLNLKGPIDHDGIILDFNYSYNPLCAYSEEYICPLPPRENFLPIRIASGEQRYRLEES